jgi:hypothetical protein
MTTPPAAPLTVRVTISPDVLHQQVEGKAVLLDLVAERYYSLNDVGTRIWGLLAEDADVDAVVERLVATYDVDEASARRDLAAFLGRLSAAGLVRDERDKRDERDERSETAGEPA